MIPELDCRSYTEFEYRVAKERRMHIIVLMRDPRHFKQKETDAEGQIRLEGFRAKLRSENVHKEWRDSQDLDAQLKKSLLSSTRPPAIAADNWELIIAPK